MTHSKVKNFRMMNQWLNARLEASVMKQLQVSGRYTASAFAVVFLLLLTPTLIWAQGASTIVGTVTDPSSGVVPNVTVQAVKSKEQVRVVK